MRIVLPYWEKALTLPVRLSTDAHGVRGDPVTAFSLEALETECLCYCYGLDRRNFRSRGEWPSHLALVAD